MARFPDILRGHPDRDRTPALAASLMLAFVLTVAGTDFSQAQPIRTQTEAEQQAGDPYFHEAAQYYVAEQKRPALEAIEKGLSVAPNHPKLLALRTKIREQESAQPQPDDQGAERDTPQSGQQENQEGTESSQEQNPQQQDGSSPQENDGAPPTSSGPDGPPGDPQPGQSNQPPQEGAGQQGAPPPLSDGGSADNGSGDGQSGEQADRLSRAQAERILQALEGQEKQLLREVQRREARPRRVEKDW